MKTIKIVRFVLLLAALLSIRPAFAQSRPAGVQLEAGIAKEEVDGDLKVAMEIYQKIAGDQSAGRDVRSKALLRLAGCYEKLGGKARQVYEQVVREYADQPAAAQARNRLASIAQQEHPAVPVTMTARKIELSGLEAVGVDTGDTDGRRVVYDSGGSLFFSDLAGHTKRLVFKPHQEDIRAFFTSHDFLMVVLILAKGGGPTKLAVIRTDGTGYRELFQDDEHATFPASDIHLSWSWDNRYLLIPVNDQTAGGRLLIVSVSDGQRRELLSVEAGRITKAAFSPDGRFVAYEVSSPPNQAGVVRVFVVPTEGGKPQLFHESQPGRGYPLWLRPRYSLMDWTADGRYVAIADTWSGKTGLYLYPVKNGATAGTPVLVRYGDLDDGQTTLTGAFVYEQETANAFLNIASLEAGQIGNWRRVELHLPVPGGPSASLSPDGHKIAYLVRDASGSHPFLYDLSNGHEREFNGLGPAGTCEYANRAPKIFCGHAESGESTHELMSFDVESGALERFGSIGHRFLLQPSHDDQAVYLVEHNRIGGWGPMFRLDLATRQETVVSPGGTQPLGEFYEWPSPDDRWLIRGSGKSLSVRSIAGGEWRSLASCNLPLSDHFAGTPDGNWAIYEDTDTAGKSSLFRVPIEGGQPQRLGDSPTGNPGELEISPDGRQILAVSYDPSNFDLWVLEHFVPSGK